ncbi:MAG: hypothetical protein A3E61_01770 [Candidatus Colwellbacteria bacterium RIFCSPHIGHO2_12_FULL_43_12]|uniref:Signal transduction histidine kinase dimerisation/phosphoacceptor domain-containing protein n=2 Tax=Candidatus Colwelliibacteriota TaxID=1817904 RepID=A0A1G1Z1B2_9BACT|nr:MAG: hypothetical protein A3E61_01770 [Candidatus Colwellbacteria bacterium RIFCSPHIGHO2_12_FULL_43_12]OGY61208.1 MAG: hypothetical protein A3F99_01280 [Candidatus Colwellbacteria bacterium RIFCSPLOWO2_12_FULL_43_11]
MPISSVALLLTIILTSLLGGIVYYKAPRNRSTTIFFLLAIAASLWATPLFVYGFVKDIELSIVLSKASHFMAVITGLFVLDFSIFFNKEKERLSPFLVLSHAAILVFLSVAMFGDFLVASISESREYITYGPWYPVYTAIVIGLFGSSIAIQYRKHSQEKDMVRRMQLRYIFFGISITAVLAMIPNLFLELYSGSLAYYWLGPIFLLIFVATTAIAVLKHHLFNVKVIATELLTFSIWAFLLIRLFLAVSGLEVVINGILLLAVVISGTILIRSVLDEVREREDLEKTSTSLADLKGNLEKKIVEQTAGVKKAYEVERNARIELEELYKGKDKFILATQHHLRTPLTIIRGYLDNLRSSAGLLPEAKLVFDRMSGLTEVVSESINELLRTTEIKVNKKDGP